MPSKKWTLEHTDSVGSGITHNKEATALLELKARLKGQLKPKHDDHYLLKWLKARNFDVDKAEQMFRNSMAYRSKMRVSTLADEYQPPEVLQKYLPGGFCGYDKEGSPVLIELYGYTDMKGIMYSAKKSDIEKTKLLLGEQVMKMLQNQSKKLDRQIDGMTVIIDMDNVGTEIMWGPGIQMYAHMGKVLQDNYPEIVKRSFIVNAPRIFPMLWKMFRPLVTEEMKNKVCILGADYQKELLKHIDADQLPGFLGGTLTDPDGDKRCPSKICQGGTVPEEYYLKEITLGNLKKANVSRGDKLQLNYKVASSGTVIRWEFKTDGYDIGFGVDYVSDEDGDQREPIVPVDRVNSHFVPEDGTLTCEKSGTYIIIFDNTYSWARAKSVSYSVELVLPTDDSLVQDLDRMALGGSWVKVAEETETTHL